jgi:hypothetical protein
MQARMIESGAKGCQGNLFHSPELQKYSFDKRDTES